jgi:hypothetical protein
LFRTQNTPHQIKTVFHQKMKRRFDEFINADVSDHLQSMLPPPIPLPAPPAFGNQVPHAAPTIDVIDALLSVARGHSTQSSSTQTAADAAASEPLEPRFFPCTFDGCTKRFSSRANMQSHERIHYPPFYCEVRSCKIAFDDMESMLAHQSQHQRPCVCDWPGCHKTFCRGNDLKVHQRTHTGERPYACSFPGCGRAFTQNSTLKTHYRLHSGEKPFECSICLMSFVSRSHLNAHVRALHMPYQ